MVSYVIQQQTIQISSGYMDFNRLNISINWTFTHFLCETYCEVPIIKIKCIKYYHLFLDHCISSKRVYNLFYKRSITANITNRKFELVLLWFKTCSEWDKQTCFEAPYGLSHIRPSVSHKLRNGAVVLRHNVKNVNAIW